eukprot:9468131-Pyramimonas_sp.AAC.1
MLFVLRTTDGRLQSNTPEPPAQQMTEGQRAEAWLKEVTERHQRRMRAAAGYHPDVSTGTRNLWDKSELGTSARDARDVLARDRYGAPLEQ